MTSTTKIPGGAPGLRRASTAGVATRTPATRPTASVAVAVEERLLAADAAEDAQAGRRVGAERGELPDLLALRALTRLERPDHPGEPRVTEDGDADEDDQPEHDRGREEDRRDDDVRDDRAREPRR